MDENKTDQPKWLPYVVVTIWLFIAMIVAIAVLARNPNHSKALELIVQLIAALGGAAAGIAGFLAVRAANNTLKQAREDRQAELEVRRPLFTALFGEMGLLYTETGENDDYIKIHFQNNGSHPAGDIKVQVLGFDDKYTREFVFRRTEANDVASGHSFSFSESGLKIQHSDSTYCIYFHLEFTDRVTDKSYKQNFYYKWRKAPMFSRNDLIRLSIEEKENLDRVIAEYEKTAPHNAR